MADAVGAAEPAAGRRARNPSTWIGALILLVVAAGAAALSSASSEPAPADAGDVVATGTLAARDDIDNGAVLSTAGLARGGTAVGSVTVRNTGDAAGTFSLRHRDVVEEPGPDGVGGSAVLALDIVMDAATPDAVLVYDGPLVPPVTIPLGEWPGGASHTFDFTVSFLDDDPLPDPAVVDDDRISRVSVTFVWDVASPAR